MKHILLATCLTLTALFLGAGPAPADDTYAPSLSTSCHLGAPRITADQRPTLTIGVASNSAIGEHGSVVLSISTTSGTARAARGLAAAVVWTKTVRYDGMPLTVRGPQLSRGNYLVTMRFTPDDESVFVGCRNSATLRVLSAIAGDVGGLDDAANGAQGAGADGLPNTGGPPLYLLVLGLALVAVGAGTTWSSRKPAPAFAHRATHRRRGPFRR